MIRSRTIYDEQLYSETDDDILINLTRIERATAITSGTGLLWEGTDGGRNSCSYGQRIAEDKPDSAKSMDGKPRLHAPSTFSTGGSVSHTHADTEDVMEATYPISENMELALGMLKDIGWSVGGDGFPTSCEATPPDVTVTFGENSYSVTEGGSATVTVELSADPERDVTIPIMVNASSTATDSVDYSTPPANVTFASGDTSKNITVAAVDDSVDDDDETVVLGFGTLPQGVSEGTPSSATVTITDNDDPEVTVMFGAADYSVTEGGTVDVTVRLSADPERSVTIPITTSGTAQSGDYSGLPANVTFASGDTSKNITVAAVDDSVDDDDETVVLGFGTLPQGVSEGTPSSATVTITDNDDPEVTVTFGAATYSVTEGGTVDVTVRLSADPERSVTIPITTSGTAQSGDYSGLPASVTFSSGETSKDITVAAVDDSVDDDDETVVLGFGTLPERVSAGTTSSTTVTITDPPTPTPTPDVMVSFGAATYSVTEGEEVTVIVTLSTVPQSSVTIPFMVDSSSTATNADYSLQSASVTFTTGENSKNITLTARDDAANEPSETVILDFGTLPQGVSEGVPSSTTVTIADNDDPPPPPPQPQPQPTSSSAESSGGCSVAAGAGHGTGSAAAHLLAAIAILIPAFFRKNCPAG